MAAIEVNQEVFNRLKQAYSQKFGSSPKRLMSKLNYQFQHDIDGNNLISERTIRNFFNNSPTPKIQETNLNYLCDILLSCESYEKAVKEFAPVSKHVKRSWLESYLNYLRNECNSVKVLTMEKPVNLDEIFVKVNIVESIKGRRVISIGELEDSSVDCNRFGQVVYQKEVPGIDVVKKHHRLMIWGMAGAGKTTFLKYLAMYFLQEFNNQKNDDEKLLPFLISLKKFAEDKNNPSLIDAFIQEVAKCIDVDINNISNNLEQFIKENLEQGNCWILLDGLDEVLAQHTNDVYKRIDEFNAQYSKNHVVITCRHGACEYVFKDFVEVEIADFDDKEIEDFIRRWFINSQKQDKIENLILKLEANPSIKELAKNPLLLTLLCLVAGENYDLPINRYSLYQEAADVLLRKWDATRNIERQKIYNEFSRWHKINMLGEIAYNAFIQNPQKYFWHKWELGTQIRKFIENIEGFKTTNLDDDSQYILKIIETHHGLMSEQAKGIYAFSHLSFQEYFTAQYILEKRDTIPLNNIIKQYATNYQWREIFIIIASGLSQADYFIKLIFSYANEFVKSDELQKMLKWLDKLTTSLQVSSSSWRAFYLTIDLDTDLYIDNEINVDRNIAESLSVKLRQINEKRNKIIPTKPKNIIARNLSVIHNFACARADNRSWKIYKASKFIRQRLGVNNSFSLEEKLQETINIARDNSDFNLADALQALQDWQPSSHANSPSEWQKWADELQKVMIDNLDIGYNVSFSEEDAKALDNYLYLSNLLLDCILAGSYTSKDVREELIDNLLLPRERILPHLFREGASNSLQE
ncbi:NACHT domain family protein [Nostoc carneum NIES-2107]|nr:NACHT domain family protein [Nostoc carneum NIES-2107]